MHTLRVVTDIAAPIERCFDLARDVDAHIRSAAATGERIVAGKTSGLLELGDEITFEGKHFGITQQLAARMTAFDRPHFFQDRMIRGAFRFMEHDHRFETLPDGRTRMTDEVRFKAPLGVIGRPVGRWIVGPHLRRFLVRRGEMLKAMAEQSSGSSPLGEAG